MDEEISELFENKTLLDDDYDWQYHYNTHEIIFYYVISIACFLAIGCDLIIIYLIARTKLMKSKTNIILLNWAIWDALFLLCCHSMFGLLMDLVELVYKIHHLCVITELEIWCQFMSFNFIIIFISTTIMKSNKFTPKYVLSAVYGIFITMLVLKTLLCTLKIHFKLMEICLLVQYLYLVVVIIVKEINLYKKRKTGGISFESKFRLNIGRIYVYSWLVSIVCLFISFKFPGFEFLGNFLAAAFLNSVFILYYIVNSDKKFKICFLSLIRCNFRNVDINDTISFAEDDASPNETHNVNFTNVNINRSV